MGTTRACLLVFQAEEAEATVGGRTAQGRRDDPRGATAIGR